MFWKRATNHGGWAGLTAGTLAALVVNILNWGHVVSFPGQGAAFLAAGIAFTVDIVVTIAVSLMTTPRPDAHLKGFVYSLTPASERRDPAAGELAWFRRPVPLAILSGGLVVLLNLIFH